MKERPILFSAPMVRALLDGRKTQTRRIAKVTSDGCKEGFITPLAGFVPRSIEHHISYCPYGKPGDRLWVRESTYEDNFGSESYARYSADDKLSNHAWWYSRETCPSIHMPRSASRILLEVTNVSIERLQDISEDDAFDEGAMPLNKYRNKFELPYQSGFHNLWESINGHGSWDLNPWVWVVAFKVLEIKQ